MLNISDSLLPIPYSIVMRDNNIITADSVLVHKPPVPIADQWLEAPYEIRGIVIRRGYYGVMLYKRSSHTNNVRLLVIIGYWLPCPLP